MDFTERLTGNRGWGRMLCVAAIAVASMGWCSTAAWAANAADLTITLGSTPTGPTETVSVSRANLATYVAYRVTLTNSSTNTINQVRLQGDTSVLNGTTTASYYGLVNIGTGTGFIQPNCGPTPVVGPSSVTCTIGQMGSHDSSDFFLIFQTPSDGSNLHFVLNTTFSEAASSTSKPANVSGRSLTNDLGLTNTPTDGINVSVTTALPPVGGRFFTGPNGAVSGTNPFSSDVTLPGVANLVTSNRIGLTTFSNILPCDGISYYCFGLQATISVNNARDGSKKYYDPATQFITIVLRQDISTLSLVNGKRKIGDVKIFYTPDNPTLPTLPTAVVPDCGPGLPWADHPCISARIDNTSGNHGYYEYQIHANDNGVWSW